MSDINTNETMNNEATENTETTTEKKGFKFPQIKMPKCVKKVGAIAGAVLGSVGTAVAVVDTVMTVKDAITGEEPFDFDDVLNIGGELGDVAVSGAVTAFFVSKAKG